MLHIPSGHKITLHTFGYYIQNAVARLKEKGAIAIVASRTPNNQWSKGSIVPAEQSEFVEYARISAHCTNVAYINHYGYVAQALGKLGQAKVNKTKLFPHDLSHTSPAGANTVAKAFVRGLLCGSSSLKDKVNSHGHAVHHRKSPLVTLPTLRCSLDGCLHENPARPVNTRYCSPKPHA
jgi:rhamnogalacturonan acetylesterase